MRTRTGGEDVGQGENSCGSRSVVVGAVVVAVAFDGGTDAEVVEVGGEEDDLVGLGAAAENGYGVPGFFAGDVFELRQALLDARRQRVWEWGLL